MKTIFILFVEGFKWFLCKSKNQQNSITNKVMQITGALVFGVLTLASFAQSSGGSGASDFTALPASFIVSIVSGEVVEGSVGSVQTSGEVIFEALANSAETGEDILSTAFKQVGDRAQFIMEGSLSLPASQNAVQLVPFVLSMPISIFNKSFGSKQASMGPEYLFKEPISFQVKPFKVGHEQQLVGYALTSQADSAVLLNKLKVKSPLQLMVLNDIGKQLYGQQ